MKTKKIREISCSIAILCGVTLATYQTLAQPAGGPGAEKASSAAKVDFAKDIKPILDAKCIGCHNSETQMSGFRVDDRNAAMKGGATGKAIVPGRAPESPLYKRVAGIGEAAPMPFGGDQLPQKTSS